MKQEMQMKETILEEAKYENLRVEAKEYVTTLYGNNKPLFDRALELVTKLGLGGLWNGIDLAIMHTAKALKNETKNAFLLVWDTKEVKHRKFVLNESLNNNRDGQMCFFRGDEVDKDE